MMAAQTILVAAIILFMFGLPEEITKYKDLIERICKTNVDLVIRACTFYLLFRMKKIQLMFRVFDEEVDE